MEESDGERPVPLHGIGPLLFHSLGALGGLVVRTVSAVPLVVMIVIMGLASGAMMPLEFLPSWGGGVWLGRGAEGGVVSLRVEL